jgi:phosphatidate cytidylyltransferase
MNKLTSEMRSKTRNRIIIGLILAIIGLPMFFLGGWFLIGFSAVGLFLAVHEFTNARPHNRYKLILHVFIMVMTFSIVYWIFFKNNYNEYGLELADWSFGTKFNNLEVSTIGIAITVAVLFLSSILNINFKIEHATYLVTMVILIGMSFQSILFLRFFPIYENGANYPWWANSFLLFYVIIGTFSCDSGAYFTGITIGRHKMNKRISPKKTWEGFIGGVVVSFVLSMAFALIVDYFGYPLLPYLTKETFYWLILLSIVMPIMANLGDFLFSAIKRHFEIKHFSTILQEHGGVLDRIDSLLISGLFVSIIIIFISVGWNILQ